MYKLLDTILNDMLIKELHNGNKWKLNEGQTGFRQGMGCEINLLRITEYIQLKYEKREEKELWTLFIDLKSAFDTVNHDILFKKMQYLEIDESLINTIRWLYRQTKIKTRHQEIKIG